MMAPVCSLSTRVSRRPGWPQFLPRSGLDRTAGRCLAILGRNGAGKSTLLSVLAGLRQPEAGEPCCSTGRATKAGRARQRAHSRLVAAEPQRGIFVDGTGNGAGRTSPASCPLGLGIREGCPHRPPGAGSRRPRRTRARDVQTLSGGERQRLSIATLLAQAPRLYLLDEPLAHLDLNHQIATLELFAALARDEGSPV
jgi:iron complex transport system ATP-binding protein